MARSAKDIPANMMPIAQGLPTNIAASVGRILARYSYCEWVQARILDSLLGISIKQGRIAVRVPPSKAFSKTVQDLLKFHKLHIEDFNFRQFGLRLEDAERARNNLAHSIYGRDSQKNILVQLVRGNWEKEQGFQLMPRALNPETKVVNKAFLKDQKQYVETAIKWVAFLHRKIDFGLSSLNKMRASETSLDRRSPPRTPA